MSMKKLGLGAKVKIVSLAAAVSLTGAVAFAPFVSFAETSTAELIAQLQAQIAALTAQLAALSGGATAPAGKCAFTRPLTVGSKGDDVTCLQNYLKSTGHFTYAGGATGFFGNVTKAAVAAWQAANGVSPAAGYFGPLSQAKYNSLVSGTTGGGTTGGGVTVPAGSGLVVSAAVQPEATLAPKSAARLPFTKVTLTASSDGDVTVKSITVQRQGLADDAAFDGILLLDEDGTQIGNTKTLSSDHTVKLDGSFVVKAGTSKTVTIAANMPSSLTNQAGQVGRLAVTAVDAGSTHVSGAFPISGNGMTFNDTLTVGSVTMSLGSLDPGAANTKDVGTTGYYLASVKASVGSAEDVTFEQIRFNQAGSAAASDLANVKVNAGGTDYPAEVSSDGKYYVVKFPGGLKVLKGNTIEFSIKADLVNGSGRTVDMDILRKSDIVVKGNTFGYYILSGGGSSGAANPGAFSSNNEPYFNAYAATINKGSLRLSSSNAVPAGNVPVNVSDAVIGAFNLEAKGEPVQISAFKLGFSLFSGTGTSTDVTGVKLVDENGNIVAGPKDPSSGAVSWTDTFTVPVGAHDYKVLAKLDDTFVTNDTVQVDVAGADITAKGVTTGLSISATPTTKITANKQTVKAATLSVSVASTPFAQNVVRGVKGFLFATYQFDAGQSGEDVRVTSIQLRDTLSNPAVGDEINNCILYDGSTALNTGSDVVQPSDPSGTTNDITFSLTNNLIVPKGSIKNVDLKCDISSSATPGSTHAWGTNASASNINSVGAQTGVSITENITTGTGQTMTIKSAGSFTVEKDSSAPSARLVIAGSTGNTVNVLKFHATDEAVKITDLTLTFSTSTASTSDFSKVTLWDGATQVGQAVWASNSQFATSTLTADFIVPKDGDKLLTLKVDVGSVGVTSSTTAGKLLAIDYDGIGSSSAIGMSSGQRLGSSSGSNTAGASLKIMKSIPTLAKLSVPTTSLPQTDAVLYRFSVTADPAGDVSLYKFTFNVSSSSVNATTSNFNLYGYSDSSFSVKAYDNNPLALNGVKCVGQSTFDTNTNCATGTSGTSRASSTEVVFFFGPVSNLASSSEAIVVPAGTTRYFELRGNITLVGSGTGNSVSVSLAGDAAYPLRGSATNFTIAGTSGIFGTADAVALQSNNNNFVWSPNSTQTSATTTKDWTNGFNVPGLPSNGMSVNTFTN